MPDTNSDPQDRNRPQGIPGPDPAQVLAYQNEAALADFAARRAA